MKKYIFKDQEYTSLWQIRRDNPHLVFCDSTPVSLLEQLGIVIREEPDPEPDLEAQAKAELEMKILQIDEETSSAITAGFDYEINGKIMHFSYDSWDQQNYADTANAVMLAKSGVAGLPESVNWNAYDMNGDLERIELNGDAFLALYIQGALAHKAHCMEAGGAKKAALLAGTEA